MYDRYNSLYDNDLYRAMREIIMQELMIPPERSESAQVVRILNAITDDALLCSLGKPISDGSAYKQTPRLYNRAKRYIVRFAPPAPAPEPDYYESNFQYWDALMSELNSAARYFAGHSTLKTGSVRDMLQAEANLDYVNANIITQMALSAAQIAIMYARKNDLADIDYAVDEFNKSYKEQSGHDLLALWCCNLRALDYVQSINS